MSTKARPLPEASIRLSAAPGLDSLFLENRERPASGADTDPFVWRVLDDVRVGLPLERQHEIVATGLAAGVDQEVRQAAAARDDAEFTRHSPASGVSDLASFRPV